MIYNSNGGFTHDEVYTMPVYLRYFYLKMLIEQKETESRQIKSQESGYSPNTKPVARPPSIRK